METGGTDCGVMKLAAAALIDGNSPVVGIVTWGIIKGRSRFERLCRSSVTAAMADSMRARLAAEREELGLRDEQLRSKALPSFWRASTVFLSI
eukprot:SAG22_NODE_513_length_9567_cov_25.867771_8_plen_93_part_00